MADHLAWLLLGSNIRPEANLRQALSRIAAEESVLAVSSVWESPPADGSDQPDYWNAAVLIRTRKSPEELYAELIVPAEQAQGRTHGADRFAARTLDIDLSLYDDRAGEVAGRRLPHPDILTRPYAAVPLAEISPDKLHPQTAEPLRTIAARLRNETLRRREDVSLVPIIPQTGSAPDNPADGRTRK